MLVVTVSPAELEHAKDLVLDLLGWGVSPEYLLQAGLSSGTMYRIFTDLRLRLPDNFPLPPPPGLPQPARTEGGVVIKQECSDALPEPTRREEDAIVKQEHPDA